MPAIDPGGGDREEAAGRLAEGRQRLRVQTHGDGRNSARMMLGAPKSAIAASSGFSLGPIPLHDRLEDGPVEHWDREHT